MIDVIVPALPERADAPTTLPGREHVPYTHAQHARRPPARGACCAQDGLSGAPEALAGRANSTLHRGKGHRRFSLGKPQAKRHPGLLVHRDKLTSVIRAGWNWICFESQLGSRPSGSFHPHYWIYKLKRWPRSPQVEFKHRQTTEHEAARHEAA